MKSLGSSHLEEPLGMPVLSHNVVFAVHSRVDAKSCFVFQARALIGQKHLRTSLPVLDHYNLDFICLRGIRVLQHERYGQQQMQRLKRRTGYRF